MNELKIRSNKKNEMIDITMNIQKHIEKENIENGYVIAYVPHTTAGITINEGADPSVPQDI
jgi:secondary thiamine-phosphate synthase enzyme